MTRKKLDGQIRPYDQITEYGEIRAYPEGQLAGYKLCPICTINIHPSNFKLHRDKHNGVRYQCPRCPKTFGDVRYTRRHMKYYHGETMKRHISEIEPVGSSADDEIMTKIEEDE